MLLTFDSLEDANGVAIHDHIERRQCRVLTGAPVSFEAADPEAFRFPIDRAIRFEADSVVIPNRMVTTVRNGLGLRVRELTAGESAALPRDRYAVDLTAPVKLYVAVESELTVEVTDEAVRLDFGDATEVRLGARSYHEQPAGTITTTDDPADMLRAIAAFGSALKTTSVERSYPTLRGHPPTIDRGDALAIPDHLEPPETGVTIDLPPALEYLYPVAPLAYYLGADLEPATEPRLRTASGSAQRLGDTAPAFEREVKRLLQQVFFLDCLTRTEGFYPVNLHERNVLEPALDLDFEALYEASLSERLDAYLSVPHAQLEPELPDWKLTARVSFRPDHIELLPFLVNDLAVVRSAGSADTQPVSATGIATEPAETDGGFTRSSTRNVSDSAGAPGPTLFRPEPTEALEQTWIGDGAPMGASKGLLAAYRNRLDRSPVDGDIDLTVVCNAGEMNEERDVVDAAYGSREELPFSIHSVTEATVDGLRSVLQRETQFLHYIGHIDSRGFECVDGFLDARDLEATGVESFFLNACQSYQQGLALIRAGSSAGIVTVEDVINSGAQRVGRALARLLNHGFPLSAALEIARERSVVGGQYLLFGDGGINIAQPGGGVPALSRLDADDPTTLTYETYPTVHQGMGTIAIPFIGDNDEYYLAGGASGRFNLTEAEGAAIFEKEPQPVEHDGELYWTDESGFDDLSNG
ncbi:MAG: hypothetical protein ABEH59_00420 [Halobacteriales archaeon]